uniref:AP complex subunit beta n=1 Tax=Chromera velia CCMP2878 TaxID=1169474 RepID=A0A0G4IER7_9ALVE|eukprot:Cvel_13810.t1-p1 / transcript=Cvel_13810.t1 / gene=Cvel_13810 / organism=Chromera_velia_CCMP2878 / gene_product=Beta-adaptin-like protein B, putative / transcript_product=Beta-adaptin-like protein B, putative / location=Cvel_scaffold958:28058-39401(+) / protein_length=915 / sequence_SO=supercontig / SO=protein_coding / is_pseudo=false
MSDGKYFQTTKRGELRELKEELHNSNKDKKKEAVKKVIAAMTVGKDVSELFPDVVNCMQTSNIELKKLVYLYVINYAKAQPELAILAVNTFCKDATDPNPLIRALAVRTMGCIRLEQIAEYLVTPLRRACKDPDPYVRKTASICIAKLFDISPDLVEDQGFIDILKEMLSDGNPMVVANSVAALSEIAESSGKRYLELTESTVSKMLAALNECTEWGQVFILDAVALYKPSTSREAVSILERITARLSHANAAVVLSAIKVVMKLLDRVQDSEVSRSLQRKLAAPLVTLLSAEPEIQYVALRNINLIVQKRPNVLAQEVKMFFCKYNDPVFVKMEKIDVMVRISSERNVEQVLSELKEYATEVDIDFVRSAVRAIGRCAIKLSRATEKCINVLLELVSSKVNYVVQEAVVVLRDIFRKYPNQYESIIGVLCENLESLDEPEAKAAMVWIIGEYAERIDNSDDLLFSFLESFHDETPAVQLQILTAVVKLFLKNPANTQDMVTRVLKMSTEETDNPDLRDRGYIYWRLLSSNPEATKRVVLAPKPPISDESFSLDSQVLDRLIENLALLSSVYHKLPEAFATKGSRQKGADDDEDEDESAVDVAKVRDKMEHMGFEEDEGESGGGAAARAGGRTSEESDSSDEGGMGGGPGDLLGLDDDDEDDSPPAKESGSPPPSVAKAVLLGPQQPGSKGGTGLGVKGTVLSHQGRPYLQLLVANASQQQMSGWALQLNKNPFGLAPASPLDLPALDPSKSAETSLALVPNKLSSGTPPSLPLMLQVAVKNNVDIFYFNCPFEISAVLVKEPAVARDAFREKWTALGESKHSAIMAMAGAPLPADAVVAALGPLNVHVVAQRNADTFDAIYLSCKTTNSDVLLVEISVQKNGNGVQVAVRSENAAQMAPLFQSMVVRIFNLQKR